MPKRRWRQCRQIGHKKTQPKRLRRLLLWAGEPLADGPSMATTLSSWVTSAKLPATSARGSALNSREVRMGRAFGKGI